MRRSRAQNVTNVRPSSGTRMFFGRQGSDHPAVEKSKIPFAQEVADILSSLLVQADYRQYYERDLDLRIRGAWTRVGDAMRLALGKPVTIVTVGPDGHRAPQLIHPDRDTSTEGYWNAIRRAPVTADMDSGEENFHVYLDITGDSMRSIEALIDEAARSGRQAQAEHESS